MVNNSHYTFRINDKPIRYSSDIDVDWEKHIERLLPGRFVVEIREMAGDAPKDFLRLREYRPGWNRYDPQTWPGFIAKVGSKRYPVESVTEHFITRVGQICGINITDSRLYIVGNQVRFLSEYFLDDARQRLTHGLDLFRRYLDEETIRSIEKTPRERQEYTFQFVETALNDWFPAYARELKTDFVTMLGFDALVGNMDRHPLNWGLIVPTRRKPRVRFAPLYDSARGLFWNDVEKNITDKTREPASLQGYVNRCQPQIGWADWDGTGKFSHFTLMNLIISERPEFVPTLRRFVEPSLIGRCQHVLNTEFSTLLSEQRRLLIVQCLRLRQENLASLLPNEA